jgi:FkbM family methyltransferase
MRPPSDAFRDAVSRSPTLRRTVKSRLAQHVIQTYRAARVVRPWFPFVVRQAIGGRGAYVVRAVGVTVQLRHRTRDIAILNEVFGAAAYDPPEGVEGRLPPSVTVTDVGGNIGLFGAYALHRWRVEHLHSFEPDPENFELLSANARPFGDRWTITRAAASTRAGTMAFAAGLYSESRQALPGETSIAVPTIDLFAEPRCDLLKLDIEGGEWALLGDPRLRDAARVIVLEWHAFRCPGPDPPALAKDLLAAAGFEHHVELPGATDGCGVLWAWQ